MAEHPARADGWVAAAAAAVLLALFVRQERRAADALVPPRLVRAPGVLGGNLTAAALTGATTPAMLTVVLYVQDTLRLPPARGSLLFPAFNLAVVAGSLLGSRLLARRGARAAARPVSPPSSPAPPCSSPCPTGASRSAPCSARSP